MIPNVPSGALNAAPHLLDPADPAERPPAPAGPTPPPTEGEWLHAHQQVAEAVLQDAMQIRQPAHRPVFKFVTLPYCPVRHPLVIDLMTLPSFEDGPRGEVPAGPELLFLASPCPGQHRSFDLLRVLQTHQVKHLVTLGDLPVSWLPTWANDRRNYAVSTSQVPTLLAQTTNVQRCGNGWSSTLALRSSTPLADGSSPATRVQRLHVPQEDVGLLPPASLRNVVDWLQTHSQPGERVALMAVNDIRTPNPSEDPFPLRWMGHQVALASALRQGGWQSGRDDPPARLQRQQRLTDATRELYRHATSLLGGVPHLSAVLEADRLGPAPTRGRKPPPARPVSPPSLHRPAPPTPQAAQPSQTLQTPALQENAATSEVETAPDELVMVDEAPPRAYGLPPWTPSR